MTERSFSKPTNPLTKFVTFFFLKWYNNIKKDTVKLLIMYFNEKKIRMTKVLYIHDRFFVSNQNFTTLHVKIALKFPVF